MTAINLDVIQVRKPCPADWDAMAGDDRVRFCGTCQRHVHNLSAMTRADATDLVALRGDSVCVRFARAAEGGTVQTLDYRPVVVGKGRRWRVVAVAASVLAAAGGGWMRWGRQAPPPVAVPMMGAMVMGDVSTPPPPPPPTATPPDGVCGAPGMSTTPPEKTVPPPLPQDPIAPIH